MSKSYPFSRLQSHPPNRYERKSIADIGSFPDPPDSIPVSQFMLDDAYGRCPLKSSRNPFTCGLSGKTYTAVEVAERVEHLARGLAKEFGWHPNKGTEWDKVVGIYALNTVCGFLAKGANVLILSRSIP